MAKVLNTLKANFDSSKLIICISRVSVGLLWINNASWKTPVNNFATLRMYTEYGSTKPVFGFWGWIIDNVILPNFTFFGWMTLITEAALGGFILVGLATRFWALVGAGMAITIALTVLNAPNEWPWSYYLLILMQLMLFATKAGRHGGIDGLLRDKWSTGKSKVTRLLTAAS